MKTPKEKANDLLDTFLKAKINYSFIALTYNEAKQCSLLCIEEQKELLRIIGTKNQLEYDELGKIQGELIKL